MSPTTTPAAARPLNSQDYKTLGLSALGGALEFYDFIIFVFFATVIGHLFFPPEMPDWLVMIQTFGIFAAGYLVRPLGGIVLAHYGDRYGRKRVFAFSILLMALSTLGMALMPTYATIGVAAPILLIILRMLQGAAIGGEVPGAWTSSRARRSAGGARRKTWPVTPGASPSCSAAFSASSPFICAAGWKRRQSSWK